MYSAIAHSIASMPRGLSGFRSIHTTHAPTTPANTTQNVSMGSTCGVAGYMPIAMIRTTVAKGALLRTSTPSTRATAPSTSSWPELRTRQTHRRENYHNRGEGRRRRQPLRPIRCHRSLGRFSW